MDKSVKESAVVVYDPESGSGYTLNLMAGDEGEIKYTAGVRAYFDCPSKRVFLCKKYQRGQCTLGAECISIHADRKVVAELRERTPKKKWVQIIFKVMCEDKEILVPYEQTLASAGRSRLMISREPAHGVLCEDFDTATCTDGEQCKSIHIEHNYMCHVRNMWRLPCCRGCHPSKLPEYIPPGGVTVEGAHIPSDSLASTKGLRELSDLNEYSRTPTRITPAKVCRLHLRHQCKWGEHCNNVHICRKLGKTLEEGTIHKGQPDTLSAVPLAIPVPACNIPQGFFYAPAALHNPVLPVALSVSQTWNPR